MTPLLLLLLGGAKRVFASALSFLGSLNAWQILCLCCLALAGLQTLKLHAELRHSAKVEKQLTDCAKAKQGLQDTLDSISTKKNEQKVITQTRIKVVHDRQVIVEKEAQKLENAPSAPGDCRRGTPPAIVAEEGF